MPSVCLGVSYLFAASLFVCDILLWELKLLVMLLVAMSHLPVGRDGESYVGDEKL